MWDTNMNQGCFVDVLYRLRSTELHLVQTNHSIFSTAESNVSHMAKVGGYICESLNNSYFGLKRTCPNRFYRWLLPCLEKFVCS